jgi:rhodanese-related sulfurtransferase
MNHSSIPEVPVTALPADAYVLDVREADEWAAGHAPDAVFLPMSQITRRVAEIPTDRTVYVMCHSGGRSAQVVQWLNPQGFDAVNVAGGILAWAGNGRPVVA